MYNLSANFKFKCTEHAGEPFCSSEYHTGSIKNYQFMSEKANLGLLNRNYFFFFLNNSRLSHKTGLYFLCSKLYTACTILIIAISLS